MIQIITLPMGANEIREASVSGEYFELRNALLPLALIELLDRNGAILARLESPEQSDYVRAKRAFETVRVTNGPTAQSIRYFYGRGDAGSRRVTGIVNVIDAKQQRSLLNQAFYGVIDRAVLAGQFAHVQLQNSIGSGKNVFVSKACSPTSAYGLVNAGTAYTGIPANPQLMSKSDSYLAGVSSAQARTEQFAAITPGPVPIRLYAGQPFNFDEPILVRPGNSLSFFSDVAGQRLEVYYEIIEQPV